MSEATVEDLVREARSLPHGPSRVAILEEAVRIADRKSDDRLGHWARKELLEAAVFGGFPEKALVAFGWLVAKSDADPENFPETYGPTSLMLRGIDLLWAYKWVVQNTPCFPQISRQQIESTLDDMEERYRRNGLSLRPVWMNRMRAGIALGDADSEIEHCFERWRTAERDSWADCRACEQNFEVEFHHYMRDYESALISARPLLHGELGCAEVPHITISNMVMPAWEHGDREAAADYHRRGYEMCHESRDFLYELAEHVDYRWVTGDAAGALELIERHTPWVADSRVGERRWRWSVSLAEVFRQLSDDQATVAVRLPASLRPRDQQGPHDTAALAAHFEQLAAEWTAKFDRRNGNDQVSRKSERLRDRLRI